MFKRIGVAIAVAMVAVVAFAVPASSQTEARLTLQIDPKEGKVGTVIHATVPEEYKDVCLSKNAFLASFQQVVAALVSSGDFSGPVQTLLQNIGALPEAQLDDLNLTFVFALAFADIATQQPVTDETTGQQATSFWDPATGQGTIEAPNVHPRPQLYAVAAVCLRLKTPEEIAQNPDEVVQALQSLGQNPDPEAAAQTLLLTLINQQPDVAWASLFCLQGDNGEGCAGPAGAEAGPAEPVAAEPKFTG